VLEAPKNDVDTTKPSNGGNGSNTQPSNGGNTGGSTGGNGSNDPSDGPNGD
jgi:hypothetical protein